jgi:hypothetical protein
MSVKIPITDIVDQAGLRFSIELAGDVFTLDIRYNDRDQRYYLSVLDEDDAIIASSVKIVRDTLLLETVIDSRRPKGEFLAVDTGARAEPTLGTLGNGVDLIFVPYTEAAGLETVQLLRVDDDTVEL